MKRRTLILAAAVIGLLGLGAPAASALGGEAGSDSVACVWSTDVNQGVCIHRLVPEGIRPPLS